MKEQLSELYSSYGKYINKFRSFPSIHDGAKIVERRLLYSLYERAKDHKVKSAEIVGWCLGQYHPHGDQSAYTSLVGLVNGGMAHGQGNWGASAGIVAEPAAAMRYTEVQSSKEILDMAFEYIKYIPMEQLETEHIEPLYLPTKFPLCLINKKFVEGIGFGSRTYIPSYTKNDLFKRLEWLLGYRKREPIIRPQTDCEHKSTNDEFKELLTTGRSKLMFRGVSRIDKATKSVIVTAIPPARTFVYILNKLKKDIEVNKTIGFTDESGVDTCVRFTSLKKSLTLASLKKKIDDLLDASTTFTCNMCDDDGVVVLTSIDDMLLNVYNNYKSINELYINSEITKIQNKIDELNLIIIIKKYLPTWLKQHPDDIDKVVLGVAKDSKIDKSKILMIFDKYTITRILKIKTDIVSLEDRKIVFENNLKNISQYVWDTKYKKYKD